MTENWVQTNRRALAFGAVPPVLIAALGAWLALRSADAGANWLRWTGVVMFVVGLGLIAALLTQLRQARIAYDGGQVLFFLRSGPPIAVPVDVVEGFFLGQGPLMLPGQEPGAGATVNLVARLSQRETSWSERDVKPALGRWHDSYVTIRGTWCEPLNGELIRRLNRRLREVTEEMQSQEVSTEREGEASVEPRQK